jgi:amidophosphoribosyltransferase
VLKAVNFDVDNTVFSFIPNTAESAFYGLIKGVEDYINQSKMDSIIEKRKTLTRDELEKIISRRPRVEKIAVKDAKLRTFIAEASTRDDLVGHVYDVTYGSQNGIDSLVSSRSSQGDTEHNQNTTAGPAVARLFTPIQYRLLWNWLRQLGI